MQEKLILFPNLIQNKKKCLGTQKTHANMQELHTGVCKARFIFHSLNNFDATF